MNIRLSILALVLLTSTAVLANPTAEEMQRKLNEEVMASPFNPGDIKKAEAYAEEAKKNGMQPVAVAPSYWQPGWTCGQVAGYRYYNYYDYRNCIYYHRYYGRYW